MTFPNELYYALNQRDGEAVIAFIRENPELVASENALGQSPFWLASCKGLIDAVKEMLKEPYSKFLVFDKQDSRFRDALDAAEAMQHDDIVEILNPIFGVGVYLNNKLSDNKIGLLDTIRSWFRRNKVIISSMKWRYQFIASLATVGFVIFLFNIFFLRPNTNNELDIGEILASSDDGAIESAISKSLSSAEDKYVRHNELVKELKLIGWDLISIEKRQTGDDLNQNIYTKVACSILLRNAEKRFTGRIEVEDIGSDKPVISENLYEFPEELNAFKSKIIHLMIEVCII